MKIYKQALFFLSYGIQSQPKTCNTKPLLPKLTLSPKEQQTIQLSRAVIFILRKARCFATKRQAKEDNRKENTENKDNAMQM